jgi:uncharacterized protein DUF3618
MDTPGDGSPSGDRVAQIRADIVAARSKIAADLEALRFKTDVPARLGDALAHVAIDVTERVMDEVTSARDERSAEEPEVVQGQEPSPIVNEAVSDNVSVRT